MMPLNHRQSHRWQLTSGSNTTGEFIVEQVQTLTDNNWSTLGEGNTQRKPPKTMETIQLMDDRSGWIKMNDGLIVNPQRRLVG